MTDMWLGYAEKSGRREVLMALRRIAPGSAVVFAQSAQDLRERLHDEEPGTVGAIVGHSSEGVSDMNLAAALAHDGYASEVVLVARGASGSLRSRASRAGIARVVDATVAPAFELVDAGGEERLLASDGAAPTRMGEAGGQRERPAALAEKVPAVEPHQAREAPLVKAGLPEASQAGRAVRAADAAPILTVSSGRGGVGKTALVALMASVAAHWGMDVAVVDLDLSCGNLHSCFGVNKGPDLVRIAPDGVPTPESMGRASVRCAEHVHLWGPCERPEMAELVMPHVATLLSYLSNRYDLVLVDTSTTFTDGVAQAVQSCDRLLVTHDERPGAVASAARISALAVRLGVARTRIVRVVNLGDPRAKANAFEGRAEVGLETARMYRVVDGGVEAEDLLVSGKVEELVGTGSDVVACVSTLLAQTLAELGKLPDNEAARKASELRTGKRRRALFSRRKEAV
jgi:pilus assembly protein CpaE